MNDPRLIRRALLGTPDQATRRIGAAKDHFGRRDLEAVRRRRSARNGDLAGQHAAAGSVVTAHRRHLPRRHPWRGWRQVATTVSPVLQFAGEGEALTVEHAAGARELPIHEVIDQRPPLTACTDSGAACALPSSVEGVNDRAGRKGECFDVRPAQGPREGERAADPDLPERLRMLRSVPSTEVIFDTPNGFISCVGIVARGTPDRR
ncbi:MAG: hypothetical protein IPL00_05895 [Gammaproteobacteria bacterium]|nr:hypothetical protein [Gammaproteobacteria bacterium]